MRCLLVLSALVAIASCKKDVEPRELSVAEAAVQFNAGTATPVDANTPEYRDSAGWVPGAVLLTDYAEYPLAELPQDKNRPLVFYCTSRM